MPALAKLKVLKPIIQRIAIDVVDCLAAVLYWHVAGAGCAACRAKLLSPELGGGVCHPVGVCGLAVGVAPARQQIADGQQAAAAERWWHMLLVHGKIASLVRLATGDIGRPGEEFSITRHDKLP